MEGCLSKVDPFQFKIRKEPDQNKRLCIKSSGPNYNFKTVTEKMYELGIFLVKKFISTVEKR